MTDQNIGKMQSAETREFKFLEVLLTKTKKDAVRAGECEDARELQEYYRKERARDLHGDFQEFLKGESWLFRSLIDEVIRFSVSRKKSIGQQSFDRVFHFLRAHGDMLRGVFFGDSVKSALQQRQALGQLTVGEKSLGSSVPTWEPD